MFKFYQTLNPALHLLKNESKVLFLSGRFQKRSFFNIPIIPKAPAFHKYKFESFGSIKPHPEKAEKGGEDAFCISENQSVIAVADGIGGYEAVGIDPALFSKGLMEEVKKAADNNLNDPLELMRNAYEIASSQKGGSTICIISLKSDILSSANLGDSGFRVFRDGEIIYATEEQQEEFNRPFQIPGYDVAQSGIHNMNVQEGDLVLCATDGIFDNVFDEDLLKIVQENLNSETGKFHLENITNAVLGKAAEIGPTKGISTPFSVKGKDYGVPLMGKVDDGTVVVSQIVKA